MLFPMPYPGDDLDFVLTSLNAQTLSSRSGNVRLSSVFNPFVPLALVFHALSNSALGFVWVDLLGKRTCGVVIDMGHGTLYIDDGVIRHTYFLKPRAKAYLDNFAQEEEDDWLSCFEVGRDEDDNLKYGPVAPSFLDIKEDMERALAMEAYFNPFNNIIVFMKLFDFLGSLPIQLKNTD
ncbi:hypothetical protein Tco_0904995 [Tanacetum coccineum]